MQKEEKTPLIQRQTEKPFETSQLSCRHFTLGPAVCLFYLNVGIGFYVISQWIQHHVESKIFADEKINSTSTCEKGNLSDTEKQKYDDVESETANWQMYNNLAVYIPATLVSVILPAYTDCFGRRFIFIVSTTGSMLKTIVYCFVIYYDMDPIYAVIGSLVEGCGGVFLTLGSGLYSVAADLTEMGYQRTVGLAIMDGCMAISITLAGLAAGYYIKLVGFFIPMVTCFGCILLSWLIFIFIVPETYPKNKRLKNRSVIKMVKRTFAFYVTDIFKTKRVAYSLLIMAYMFESLSNSYRAGVEMLFQLGRPFCWSPDKIGLFSGLRHVLQGIAAIALVRPLQRCFSDLVIAILSLGFLVGSYILEAFSTTDLMLYMVPVLATFSYLCESMIKSLMSTITPSDKQGSLFSSIVMVQGICISSSNFISNSIYANTVSFMSGFVFFEMAGCAFISCTILLIFAATQRKLLHESSKNNSVNITVVID